MKNTFKILGIIALLAIIGIAMAACESDDSVSLPGTTWKCTVTYDGSVITTTLAFATSTVTLTQTEAGKGPLSQTGTYTFNGNSGTMTFTDTSVPFAVNGNKLTINNDSSSPFIKQ